jgi:electron transfer flavoprotein alpha subunit
MPDTAILVVAELRDGEASPLTRELLGLARDLADGEVATVLLARSSAAAADLIAHGADRIYFCQVAEDEYEGEIWLPNVEHLAREIAPRAVLVGHTPAGADLAPRLAFRLNSAVATGCVGAAVESGRLTFTRPCYGGNVRETVSFACAPAVATIKAGVGAAQADAGRRGEIVRVIPREVRPRTRLIARERDASGAKRLEDAKIVVAGGRGLEGPEGFRMLEDLAGVLDGVVGSSRVPCDLGWVPHSWQIGLTGRTVTPDLYFAVGISGAGHHMAGCGNAKTIVAINTDPEAAIFRSARFGIVGDYRKVVPALVAALKDI